MTWHKMAMSSKPPAVKMIDVFLSLHNMTLASLAGELGLTSEGRHTLGRVFSGTKPPSLDVALALECYTGIPAIAWWTDEQALPFQLRAQLLADGKGPPKKKTPGRPRKNETND